VFSVVALPKAQRYIKCLLRSETSPSRAIVPACFLEQNVSISFPWILDDDDDDDDDLHLDS